VDEGIKRVISSVAEVAGLLWERGWANAGAGNLSVDVSGFFAHGPGATCILITARGSRMSDVARNPGSGLGVIEIPGEGEDYRVIWPENVPFSPTSELPTHLELHRAFPGTSVVHAHPAKLVAIARRLADELSINSALYSVHIESPISLPRGVGLVSGAPGSSDLAFATARALANHDLVIWASHGAVAVAPDLRRAFDLMDVANKAAEIYLVNIKQ